MVQEAGLGAPFDPTIGEEVVKELVQLEPSILEPGQYLIELQIAQGRTLDQDTLSKGLALMGWSKVCPDVSDPSTVRFVGETERPIAIAESTVIRWNRITVIAAVDVFGELEYRLKPLEVEPGKVYELLFIARTKSHRTRDDVRKALSDMSFQVDELSLLKKDMRVPGYPGASAGLWFAIAKWPGPEGYVNADDAFVFECVEPITGSPKGEPPRGSGQSPEQGGLG